MSVFRAGSARSGGGRRWSVLRRGAGSLLTCVLLVFVVLAWPARFGGRVGYVIVAGRSMTGTYSLGDLLVTSRRSQYRVGEVVVYRVPVTGPGHGIPVVHRLVGGTPEGGFRTRGDANAVDDPWLVHPSDIDGAVIGRVPHAGVVLHFATSPLGWAVFAGLAVLVIVYQLLTDEDQDSPQGAATAARSVDGSADGPGGAIGGQAADASP